MKEVFKNILVGSAVIFAALSVSGLILGILMMVSSLHPLGPATLVLFIIGVILAYLIGKDITRDFR